MFATLVAKELKSLLLSPKFGATFGACSLLLLLSTFAGVREYRADRAAYETALQLTDAQAAEANNWRHFTYRAHREPDPMKEDAFRRGFPVSMRAEEPDYLSPSDFAEDRRYRLVREAVEKEKISVARAAEILGLSLRQMRDLSKDWVDAWSGKTRA